MRHLMTGAMLFEVLAVPVVSTFGCVPTVPEMIHNSAAKKFPTYAETEATWGPIPAEQGRVVVFAHGGVDSNGLGVQFDNGRQAFLMNKTFVFTDLPADKHSVKLLGVIFGPGPAEFIVVPGEVTYVRVAGRKNPLAKREAQPLLANVYHYYRMPLPFDKQDKTAERVKW